MIFQYFSRQILFSMTFQESPINSSTFQACANPGTGIHKLLVRIGKSEDLDLGLPCLSRPFSVMS